MSGKTAVRAGRLLVKGHTQQELSFICGVEGIDDLPVLSGSKVNPESRAVDAGAANRFISTNKFCYDVNIYLKQNQKPLFWIL